MPGIKSKGDQNEACPESTIDSVFVKNSNQILSTKQSADKYACESTTESGKRRGFIKNAVLGAAAVAIGSTILGNKNIPDSYAKSFSPNANGCFNDVCIGLTLVVDKSGSCNGGIKGVNSAVSIPGQIIFGTTCGCHPPNASERIGSQRNCCSICCVICPCSMQKFPPGHNLRGLDFYTNYSKRVSITNSGNVGIGTCTPSSRLEVLSTGCGVIGCVSPTTSGRHVGVVGKTGTGCGSTGVAGYACNGGSNNTAGVYGASNSTNGRGVVGNATSSSGQNIGVLGISSSPAGVGVLGLAEKACTIPMAARAATSQVAPLFEWQKNCGMPLSSVNKCGWIGIGLSSPKTPLQINGGMSAKIANATGTYVMGASDFAILANAASGAFTVTLPPANTAPGMLVFIKKIDSTTNVVKIHAAGIDKIEGKAAESLSSEFKSLYLISDGVSSWYIMSNAT